MAPAFGRVEAKYLLPYFVDSVNKAPEFRSDLISVTGSRPCHQMADKWSSIIENSKTGYSAVLDANMWLGKAALDACVTTSVSGVRWLWLIVNSSLNRMGAGAFDYDFGALDDSDNSFTKSYTNLMYDHPSLPSVVQGFHRVNSLPCSPVLHPSEIPLDCSFSSRRSRVGFQDCSRGYSITPIILECRTFGGTRTKRTGSLGNYWIRRDKS